MHPCIWCVARSYKLQCTHYFGQVSDALPVTSIVRILARTDVSEGSEGPIARRSVPCAGTADVGCLRPVVTPHTSKATETLRLLKATPIRANAVQPYVTPHYVIQSETDRKILMQTIRKRNEAMKCTAGGKRLPPTCTCRNWIKHAPAEIE
jgi:hypothetical protein